MKKIVVASNNAHKVEEIQRVLEPYGLSAVPLSSFGSFPEPIEDADSFEGNARIKARAAFENTGLPSLADDSGLVVDALGGAPGIYSSRYAGEGASASERNEKLLHELEGIPENKRTARFVCVLVLVRDADTESEIVVTGTCEGKVSFEEYGAGGFGYDPVFIADAYPDKTVAELSSSEKDAISHRGDALRKFIAHIKKDPIL